MAEPEVVEALGQIRDCLREILTQLTLINHPPMVVNPDTLTDFDLRPGLIRYVEFPGQIIDRPFNKDHSHG